MVTMPDLYDLQERVWCLQRGYTAPGAHTDDDALSILCDLIQRLQYPEEEGEVQANPDPPVISC